MLSAVSTPIARGRRCVPPAPGRSAELHFGQRDLRARRRDAEVAAERELQAAAHADAADRRDDRLGARLDDADDACASVGSAVAFGVLNSRMSAPPEKALPAPVRTIALTAGIGQRPVDPGDDADADVVAQAVDRRVVQRDDGDGAVQLNSERR